MPYLILRNEVQMAEKALAYLRTSSAANVGGDSDTRQRDAIRAFADVSGFEIVGEFYDAATRGTDLIEHRQGFTEMLSRIEGNGVRTVIVEDASRLARSVLVSELAVMLLIQRGVRVLTASGDDLTATDDPTRVMMRQIASAFAQYEKARLVAKLKHARDRKRKATGRCEGVLGYDATRPELVAEAQSLAADGRPLRAISAELLNRGYMTSTGKPFSPSQVKRLLGYNVTAPNLLEAVRNDAAEVQI
jgi:DNA invertase Pin-like site-specific DNA recombinase